MITILQQNPTTLSFVLEVITTKRKETYIQFKEHNTTSFTTNVFIETNYFVTQHLFYITTQRLPAHARIQG